MQELDRLIATLLKCSCTKLVATYVYRIRQNFRGGKLSRLCTKHTIHWKTFAVHQAHAIMYCTQQMIQGENFRDWLKNRKNRESFPPRKFCRIRYNIYANGQIKDQPCTCMHL